MVSGSGCSVSDHLRYFRTSASRRVRPGHQRGPASFEEGLEVGQQVAEQSLRPSATGRRTLFVEWHYVPEVADLDLDLLFELRQWNQQRTDLGKVDIGCPDPVDHAAYLSPT